MALLGCPNPSTNPNAQNAITFNLNGAKALAAAQLEEQSRSGVVARDTSSEAGLGKILADGSFTSLINLGENVNPDDLIIDIDEMVQCPSENSNEIYFLSHCEGWPPTKFCFSGSYKDGTDFNIGPLVCIHEDGTYDDVIDKDWKKHPLDARDIQFDNDGNAYYILNVVQKNGGYLYDVIYKFDPKTRKNTQLTDAGSSLYQKIQVSGDGEWVFAEGGHNNGNGIISFLRAIPVNAHDNPAYIFNGNVGFKDFMATTSPEVSIYSWFFDQKHGILLFSGTNEIGDTDKNKGEGLFRINKVEGKYSLGSGIERLSTNKNDSDCKSIKFYCLNDDGSLYGINSDNKFIKLIAADGTFSGDILASPNTSDYNLSNVTYTKDGFYFMNTKGDYTTGFKNDIMFFNLSDKSFKNVLENVQDKDDLEIFAYSAGEEDLYFSAARGTSIVSGKIDVGTKAYSTLGVSKKFTSILTLK